MFRRLFTRGYVIFSTTYTGSEGNSATATTGPDGNTAITGPDGNTLVTGQTYDDSEQDNYSSNTYTGPAGNSATVMSGTSGSAVVATNNNSSSGIAYSDIPAGQQDLYILKSQIVPPVCPACPPATACPRQEACPPCPACERCPEPAFECKKCLTTQVLMKTIYLVLLWLILVNLVCK